MWKLLLALCFVGKVEIISCESNLSADVMMFLVICETHLQNICHGGEKISASPQASAASHVSPSSYSRIEMTITLDLNTNSTVEHDIQPTQTAVQEGQQTIKQTISPSMAAPAVSECRSLKWEDESLNCADAKCMEEKMKDSIQKSKCLKEKPQNVTLTAMAIYENLIEVGLSFAGEILKRPDNVSMTAVILTDVIAMEVGVLDSKDLNETKLEYLTFPNYSNPAFNDTWIASGDRVAIHVTELSNTGKTIYAVAIFKDLPENGYLKRHEILNWNDNIIVRSKSSELYVKQDQLYSHKKVPPKRINSNIISASFQHDGRTLKGPLKKPVQLTFQHNHQERYTEPRCVHWDKKAWSMAGCSVKESSKEQTISECSYMSSFALVMTEEIQVDDSHRRMVVTVASVLGSFSMLGLLICIIVAIVVNYHNMDNMRIAFNIDISLLFSHLVFFIGLSTSDNLFYSKPQVCKVISPFVHLFELAALMFLLMEGFYYYSTLKPFFNEKNTVPIVFYFAMGWGIPIAFACACAEYKYPHFGIPERSAFCWLFIQGDEAWFFAAPVLILVLLNIGIRACVLKEVICWKGDPDDIAIHRAKIRLVTSIILMSVIVMTWLFGVLSVNHTENKILNYFFIVFYTFQGLLVFLFYCVRNEEMWDFYKGKKEEEEREKNAAYSFVYVP